MAVLGEVEAVELLQRVPSGFEAGVGAEELLEAGAVGVGEGVAASQQREIRRARQAMRRCIAEGHTAEEDG